VYVRLVGQGVGFVVWDAGFRARVQSSEFCVDQHWHLGVRGWDSEMQVQGFGFGVKLMFEIGCSRCGV